MNELPPPPGGPAENEPAGLHPFPIALALVFLSVAGILLVASAAPDLWWLVAIGIPVVGGALAAFGHAPSRRLRRFFGGLVFVLGIEIALGAITLGIIFWICTSMAQGTA